MRIKLNLSETAKILLRKMPDLIIPSIYKGMKEAMLLAERTAKGTYLSGKALQRRTGRLRGSITQDVKIEGNKVVGTIGTDVVYGRIHELGGVIKPKKAKLLRFRIPGVGWRSAKEVIMPARPFLRPSLDDNMSDITRILSSRIEEAFRKI